MVDAPPTRQQLRDIWTPLMNFGWYSDEQWRDRREVARGLIGGDAVARLPAAASSRIVDASTGVS
jgi:hypothetical protein